MEKEDEIQKTKFEGLVIINPKTYEDERGCFFESYNENEFKKQGLPINFVQDNQSISKKGVFRGFHLQKPPFAQGKFVRVIKGKVLDICIDLRKESQTYLQKFSIELNEKNKKELFVPKGFAHGFLALEDNTIFQYKCTDFYNKKAESGIRWDDPELNIDLQLEKYGLTKQDLMISEKDKKLPFLKDLDTENIISMVDKLEKLFQQTDKSLVEIMENQKLLSRILRESLSISDK